MTLPIVLGVRALQAGGLRARGVEPASLLVPVCGAHGAGGLLLKAVVSSRALGLADPAAGGAHLGRPLHNMAEVDLREDEVVVRCVTVPWT